MPFRRNEFSQHEAGSGLELDHLALPLLLSSKLKMLGPLNGNLMLPLAGRAFEPQDQLLGGLCLLPQDRLGLSSKALLLTIVPPPSLGLLALSCLLVLGDLKLVVLVAPGTVGVPRLGDVHHDEALSLLSQLRASRPRAGGGTIVSSRALEDSPSLS